MKSFEQSASQPIDSAQGMANPMQHENLYQHAGANIASHSHFESSQQLQDGFVDASYNSDKTMQGADKALSEQQQSISTQQQSAQQGIDQQKKDEQGQYQTNDTEDHPATKYVPSKAEELFNAGAKGQSDIYKK
jgi:hypothetical protein